MNTIVSRTPFERNGKSDRLVEICVFSQSGVAGWINEVRTGNNVAVGVLEYVQHMTARGMQSHV
jgi:hypothetical protein